MRSDRAPCRGASGPCANTVQLTIWVDEVDSIHRRCLEEGLDVTWPPTDMPWGVRELHVRHPDGHVLRISQRLWR
jgi:uncharacterized glyoxalase superfamily protein PhnB